MQTLVATKRKDHGSSSPPSSEMQATRKQLCASVEKKSLLDLVCVVDIAGIRDETLQGPIQIELVSIYNQCLEFRI